MRHKDLSKNQMECPIGDGFQDFGPDIQSAVLLAHAYDVNAIMQF
jgi:hypothetical protein